MSLDARQKSMERKKRNHEIRIAGSTGIGRYVYKNMSPSDIGLPRPSLDGRTYIPSGGTFEGDSYFATIPGIVKIQVIDDGMPKEEIVTAEELGIPIVEVSEPTAISSPEEIKIESHSIVMNVESVTDKSGSPFATLDDVRALVKEAIDAEYQRGFHAGYDAAVAQIDVGKTSFTPSTTNVREEATTEETVVEAETEDETEETASTGTSSTGRRKPKPFKKFGKR